MLTTPRTRPSGCVVPVLLASMTSFCADEDLQLSNGCGIFAPASISDHYLRRSDYRPFSEMESCEFDHPRRFRDQGVQIVGEIDALSNVSPHANVSLHVIARYRSAFAGYHPAHGARPSARAVGPVLQWPGKSRGVPDMPQFWSLASAPNWLAPARSTRANAAVGIP